MITKQSLTFILVACLISWSLVIGGFYGGLVEVPWSLLVLSLSMLGPSISALICAYAFEGGFKGIKTLAWKPHFSRNIWWFLAWLIPVLMIFGSMALTLGFSSNAHLQSSFKGVEIGPLLLFQALVIGPLINMPILTFTEELGWRGYLYQLWRGPFGFWATSLVTGFIWGLWHAPAVFFYGLNYPQHPVLGIALFTVWCTLFSPIITLVREKTGSLWAAGLFHGTINALGGVSVMLLDNPPFPWNGLLGIGGFCVLIFILLLIKGQVKNTATRLTTLFVAMCSVCAADFTAEVIKSPEVIQEEADTLREAGKTLEALDLYNHALVGYQQIKDYHGILRVLCGRPISWQHLFNHEEDKLYAILARKEAEAILAIAKQQDIQGDCSLV